ncbi:MAG: glycosyltransferase family 39 protein [Prolixibacteraceae bacterium]|nr:glycosyltransferase family 39 protein [Prolixibacteraceae bacterium]
MQHLKFHKNAWWIIPIIFLLFSAPSALDYVFHFPDEKYYTDAVLQMMEKGDYFTPYKADGSPRFFKPIATYWVLIGSYKLFGVSRISSRIFFWLAGALLTMITFLMTQSLTRNRKIAITAAIITAANPLVLMSASRSIPDILLTLFLTISAWGFLEIMINENIQKKHYWMAYIGAALAFETKGLPAAAFAGASMLFLIFNPWHKIKLKKLLEPYSIVISVVVALSWFIIMYAKHGSVYLNSFFADQVGERVSSKAAQVFTNGTLGIVTIIAFFIPWIFIVFSKPRELKKFILSSDKKQKAIFGFILLWIVLIVFMSAVVFKFYDRYILPIIPLGAILMASVFVQSKTRFQKTIFSILISINAIVLGINLLYAIFILPDPILIAGIIISLSTIAIWQFTDIKNTAIEHRIAGSILLLFFNAFILLYPLLMPNPGEQIVDRLKEQGIRATDKIYVYGNIRAASNIRIHSNNRWQVVSMDTVYAIPADPEAFLVFSKEEGPFLHLDGYSITEGSEEWSRVPVEEFPKFMQNAILKLKESGTKYYIAKPRTK